MSTTKKYIVETKPPKAFHMPTIAMISAREPTERYVLWIISKCPYAFNPLFTGQFFSKHPELVKEDSNFRKAYKILDSLYAQKMIRPDVDGNYHLTILGRLHRLRTHPAFPISQTLVTIISSILIALTVFKCSH